MSRKLVEDVENFAFDSFDSLLHRSRILRIFKAVIFCKPAKKVNPVSGDEFWDFGFLFGCIVWCTYQSTLTYQFYVFDKFVIDAVLRNQSINRIQIYFQRFNFEFELLWHESPLVMRVEEFARSRRSFKQKPDDLVFDDADEGQIFAFLFIPQNDHAIVWVVHLCQLFLCFPSIEVVFYEVDIIFITFWFIFCCPFSLLRR